VAVRGLAEQVLPLVERETVEPLTAQFHSRTSDRGRISALQIPIQLELPPPPPRGLKRHM
jgi:hypothetical protein